MTTMKLGGGIFFFLIILFIAGFQTSNAVQCYRAVTAGVFDQKMIECSTCVRYGCGSAVHMRLGCPENFFNECKDYAYAIKFIKRKIHNALAYNDGKVAYLSGWNTLKLLEQKNSELEGELKKMEPNEDNPVWFCKHPGDGDYCNSGRSNFDNKLTEIIIIISVILLWLQLDYF